MSSISREKLLELLSQVIESKLGKGFKQDGLISGVVVRGSEVGFVLNVDAATAHSMEPVRVACEQAVAQLPGITKVTAVMTAVAQAAEPAAPAAKPNSVWNKQPVEHVRHIVAVASGKGGVGKSTATLCLAYALAAKGLRVGVLDADIYGPSMPRMFGLSGQPDIQNNKMVPLEKDGIKVMSAGFLMDDEAAILRGPMITKALHQMLHASLWGTAEMPLDVLLLDLPPGTGDVQLSLAQKVMVDGAVVVTTPQQVAISDARKAVQMFRKVDIRVFGILENMSYLETGGGQKIHPFGQGGGDALAREMSTLSLGQVPLVPSLGEAVDRGAAPVIPEIYSSVAAQIMQQLHVRDAVA